jgi:type IV fimbrial biogenesis protein FimT
MTLMSEVCNKLTMERVTGFTLVELLITIVVVSILLAAGVPAFKDFIKNNRVTAQTNDLVSAIQLARSEALKRGVNTVVCASQDQKTCTEDKNTWADGWIVYSDFDPGDGTDPVVGSGICDDEKGEDCIMKTSNGLSEGSSLTATADRLCFLPTGLPGTNSSTDPASCTTEMSNVTDFKFTLEAKNCEKNQAREITVKKQGHTLVSTCTCGGCS